MTSGWVRVLATAEQVRRSVPAWNVPPKLAW